LANNVAVPVRLGKGAAALIGMVWLIPGNASAGRRSPSAAGTLDMTFGGGGAVLTDFGDQFADATGVAVDDEGRIVAAGSSEETPIDATFVLSRHGDDGALDPTFGAGGKVVTTFPGGGARARAVAIRPDGRIVVVGTFVSSSALEPLAVARYNPDGAPDATFGVDGRVLTDAGGSFLTANAMALDTDGRIVVAGFGSESGGGRCGLVRFNLDGSLDGTFGAAGVVLTDLGGNFDQQFRSVAIQPDGKIVAAGFQRTDSEARFTVARYDPDGHLDPLFGDAGVVLTSFGADFGGAEDLVIQSDGKIVTAGAISLLDGTGRSAFALVRYLSDGELDPSFGTAGRVVSDFAGGATAVATAVALDSHERIVVGGAMAVLASTSGGERPALARYDSYGRLDPSFGNAGKASTDLGTLAAGFNAIAIDGADRIVAAGVATTASAQEFILARYNGGERRKRVCHPPHWKGDGAD
jgi:uncharacterized delta-60 repeat protein